MAPWRVLILGVSSTSHASLGAAPSDARGPAGQVVLASTALEAVAHLVRAFWRREPFDLVVVDGTGERLVRGEARASAVLLAEGLAAPGVVFVARDPDRAEVLQLLLRGVRIVRATPPERLSSLVGRAREGAGHLPILARFGDVHRLSVTEILLLQEAADGLHDKEATETLGSGRGALAKAWSRIFDKLDVRSQQGVLAKMLRWGFNAERRRRG